MTKVAINKEDKDRAILTDSLPYETPVIFSNEGLYAYKKSVGEIRYQDVVDENSIIQNLLSPNKKYTIPYEYEISKNIDSVRILSVIHPKNQIDVAKFYSRFDHQIIHLCSLSPASLRFPSSVASHYYERLNKNIDEKHKSSGVEVESIGSFEQPAYASSYFVYKKYNFLYKFYNSKEFINLEKKFHSLLVFDLSKCFSSIYTHSISWAVKDKEYSKKYKDAYSFESEFDQIMQNSNYNETNGIVIGPEISRIFAEIILQRIDRDSIKKIYLTHGLTHDVDYSVRRYVDDCYLFTRSKEISEKIFSIYTEKLSEYKLHINESKTMYYEVPFISGLTMARNEINEFLTHEIAIVYDIKSNEVFINSPYSLAKKWISSIKSIIKRNQVTYDGVSVVVISRLKKLIVDVLDTNIECSSGQQNKIKKLLYTLFDVLFFVYSMDVRVRTTYVVSQAIIHTTLSIRKYEKKYLSEIKKHIFDESIHILKSPAIEGVGFTLEKTKFTNSLE